MMKILLINPPGSLDLEYGELKDSGALYPSLGLAHIASVANEAGHDTRVLDAEALQLNFERIEEEVRRFTPDIIGLQAFCTTQERVFEICRRVKSLLPQAKIVVGGVQMTLFKKSLLELESAIDFGIYGEGERAFTSFLKGIEQGGDYSHIKGLIWRHNGRIVVNPPQPLIKTLDDLPFPSLGLFPLDRYHSSSQLRGSKTLHIMTSRGCPYRCVYCSSNQIFGRTHRYYSTDRVLRELKYMQDEYGVDSIQFYDEVFTMHRKRVVELCKALIEQGNTMPWTCFTRVNLVDRDLLQLMAQAGCYQIFYGLESGVQRLLDLVQKDITLEQTRKAIRETRQAGIESVASFMLTLPTETVEETWQTINFGLEVDPDYVYWLTCTPYPGTRLYELAQESGTILEHDYSRYNVFNEIVYLPEGRTREEIEATLKKAYRKFYLRPKYLARRLKGFHKLPPWKLWNLVKSGLRMFY